MTGAMRYDTAMLVECQYLLARIYYDTARYTDCLALLATNLALKKYASAEMKGQTLKWINELARKEGLPTEVVETALNVLDELEGSEASESK
jgi:hypothetical protein